MLNDTQHWYISKGKSVKRLKGALAAKDWTTIINQSDMSELKQLDDIAVEHIDNFWKPYGINLGFEIEHKLDNCFVRAGYFGKAHYFLDTIDGTPVFKIRGCKNLDGKRREILDNFEEGYETVSDKTAMTELLQAFALGEDHCLFIPQFEQSGLMKVSDWRHNKEMMPGDELIKNRRDKLKGSHLPFDCLNDIERYNKQVMKTDLGYEIMADGRTLNIKLMMKKIVADQKKGVFAPELAEVA